MRTWVGSKKPGGWAGLFASLADDSAEDAGCIDHTGCRKQPNGVGEDPVKLGLVASLARPGGNLTGINFFATELQAKRLQLLHEMVPKAVRIAVLVNPANIPATESALRDIPDAARALGLQIQVLKASTKSEIEAAFATLVRDRAEALYVAGDLGVAVRQPPGRHHTRMHTGTGL